MSRRMSRAANGIPTLIHAVAGSGYAITRAHLAFVGPLDSVVFSQSRENTCDQDKLCLGLGKPSPSPHDDTGMHDCTFCAEFLSTHVQFMGSCRTRLV